MPGVNPYLNRTAIRDDTAFVGRTAELTRLFNRIGGSQPQSVSIVGDRRIGKSSLLRAIIARRGKHLARPDRYHFALLDVQSRIEWSVDKFFERVISEIDPPFPHPEGDSGCHYEGFEEWVRLIQKNDRVLVILIDEFHRLMQDEGFSLEFFNYLRSLANSYPVSLVVTSHVDLHTLSKDHNLSGSPLFNILHKLHLGPFSEDEARHLIRTPSALEGCPLDADEPWIIRTAGHWPLYLQIACSVAYEWRTEHAGHPLDTAVVDRRFMEEAEAHFVSTWRVFSEEERHIISAVARNQPLETHAAPGVESLVRRGYLERRGPQLNLFCEPFRAFAVAQDAAPVAAPEPPAPVPPRYVFLSYAREDAVPVKDLYDWLIKGGYAAWLDREDIVPGQTWAVSIHEAIRRANCVVLCLSTRSVEKTGVLKQELAQAMHQWYAHKKTVIPALLEDCAVPPEVAHLQWVELWNHDGRTRLLRALDGKTPASHTIRPLVNQGTQGQAITGRINAGAFVWWVGKHALLLGLTLTLLGVLLLIGGLSGEVMSAVISLVGLARAHALQPLLRVVEVTSLVAGAAFLVMVAVRSLRRVVGVALGAAVAIAMALLIGVEVPAPHAYAMAYEDYLSSRTPVWRTQLLGFRDSDSGGIRDGADSHRVQAWTTAQSIVGLLQNVRGNDADVPRATIRPALEYLERVRLADGWGYFADKNDAITEVTSWATLAQIRAFHANIWDASERSHATERILRDLRAISSRRTASGGWSPVAEVHPDNSRSYSTVMAMWALLAAREAGLSDRHFDIDLEKGREWLLHEHHRDLGWVPNPGRRYQTEEFPGLTGQILVILQLLDRQLGGRNTDARLRAAQELFVATDFSTLQIRSSARVPDADQHLVGSSVVLEGSTFLWYPWSLAALALLSTDPDVSASVRAEAGRQRAQLTLRTEELTAYLENALPYQIAENLLGLGILDMQGERLRF